MPIAAPRITQEPTAIGIDRAVQQSRSDSFNSKAQHPPRIPARNPAAQAPAAPFSASLVSRVFATTDSVNAKVAPMAPVEEAREMV